MKWVEVNVEGFEHYQVSDAGQIKNRDNLIMSSRACKTKGYRKIGLRHIDSGKQKTFLVHRIVAESFLSNPENKKTVNHIDGDKNNNAVSNLEWATQSENQIHAYKIGLQELTEDQVNRLKGLAVRKRKAVRVVNKKLGMDEVFESIAAASRSVACNEKTLRNVLKGRNVSRLGYEVSYIE